MIAPQVVSILKAFWKRPKSRQNQLQQLFEQILANLLDLLLSFVKVSTSD